MTNNRWLEADEQTIGDEINEAMAEAYVLTTRVDYLSEDNIEEVMREFVFESNEIEGYPRDKEGHPNGHLFSDHYDAALTVARGAAWMWAMARVREPAPRPFLSGIAQDPLDIHAMIMKREKHAWPGEYRQMNVMVGGRTCMKPQKVRERIPKLIRKVQEYVLSDDLSAADERVWEFHHEFEFIHPFADGNGRTGRLWMNAIRLSFGLPWLTVYASGRYGYYDSIVDWIERKGSS